MHAVRPSSLNKHAAGLHPQHSVGHLPDLRRVADENDPVEASALHCMPEYPTLANFWNLQTSAYFFPGTGELGLQQTENDARACLSPDCLVPEERIVADAFPPVE